MDSPEEWINKLGDQIEDFSLEGNYFKNGKYLRYKKSQEEKRKNKKWIQMEKRKYLKG